MYDNEVIFHGQVISVREDWWKSAPYKYKPSETQPDFNPVLSNSSYNAGVLVRYRVLQAFKGIDYRQEFMDVSSRDYRKSGVFQVGEKGLVVANFWPQHNVYKLHPYVFSFLRMSGCRKWGGVYQDNVALRNVRKQFVYLRIETALFWCGAFLIGAILVFYKKRKRA